MSVTPALILASSSVYRRELLERLGLSFLTLSPEVDETPLPGEGGAVLALRLARLKACTVAASHPQAIVIGSDQVAECDGQMLGKPGSEERALAQLKAMRGRLVIFYTAVALARGKHMVATLVPTEVRMRPLADACLARYVVRDRPIDCAGAFKSERAGIALAESMRSDDPTALIGLPLIATVRLLAEFGVELP